MSTAYRTGTRYPGNGLKQFLPQYPDLLHQRGDTLLTTNKPGVDRLILQHCDRHQRPLQVIDFACAITVPAVSRVTSTIARSTILRFIINLSIKILLFVH